MAAPLTGMDVSHYQGRPNLALFKAAGNSFLIAKCTQGVTFIDSEFPTTRSDAHAVGLVFGGYHFAGWGDPVAEANFFLQHATPKAGELVALDVEGTVPAGVDVVAWSDAFSRAVKAALGIPPMIYMNGSWLAGHNWAPVIADNDSLWLAKYDGPVQSPSGQWPVTSFKQYTDRAIIPGVSGPVDGDDFFGDLATLMKYTVPTQTSGDLLSALSDAQQLALLGAVNDIHGWLRGGDPAHDNVFLIWAQGVTAAAALAAVKAELDATKAELDALKTLLATTPPGTDAVAAAVVAAVDADLSKRFGNSSSA